jgi:hypothetical protein
MFTGTAAVILLGVWCFGNSEWYISIDAQTGMVQHTQAYGPFEWHTIQQSALSRVLVQNGYRESHQHQWVYEAGGGKWRFGRFCGQGNGYSIRRCIDSPEVVSAVQLMIANSDRQTTEKWLQRIFDPNSSLEVSSCLWDVEQHTNKNDFLKWIQEQDAEFTETLQIETNH